MSKLSFDSHGDRCGATYVAATSDDLPGDTGRPCVVMAHGFACTRDGGLMPFAERFAAAGCDVLLFDYRGFGTSGGEPRQDVNHVRHRQDYAAAVAFARGLDGVDPERVSVWGTSYSGGHVVAVAAADPRIAAVVSQGAAMDGLAVLRGSRRSAETSTPSSRAKARRLFAAATLDAAGGLARRTPVMVPVFAEPGELAVMNAEGSPGALGVILGPTFRNEMCARGVLRIGFNRPVRVADRVGCPMLLVAAERDEIAPASSVHEVARRAPRAELTSYDCSHFAIYTGEVFEASVERQVAFLREQLSRPG